LVVYPPLFFFLFGHRQSALICLLVLNDSRPRVPRPPFRQICSKFRPQGSCTSADVRSPHLPLLSRSTGQLPRCNLAIIDILLVQVFSPTLQVPPPTLFDLSFPSFCFLRAPISLFLRLPSPFRRRRGYDRTLVGQMADCQFGPKTAPTFRR